MHYQALYPISLLYIKNDMLNQLLEKKEFVEIYVKALKKLLRENKEDLDCPEVFRLIRLSMGLSQKEMAEKINVSKKTIYRWEAGEIIPELTFSQYSTLYNDLKEVNINFLRFNCYRLTITPDECRFIIKKK